MPAAATRAPSRSGTPPRSPSARCAGRHRVAKQRGGGLARSSTVLGVGVAIAAVGAGGMASAQTGKPPVSISMPDLPNVGSLISDEEEPAGSATPLSGIGVTTADAEQGTAAVEAHRAHASSATPVVSCTSTGTHVPR
ncbi:hypothetical protein STENM327S_04129 [Streptomyces tendae]